MKIRNLAFVLLSAFCHSEIFAQTALHGFFGGPGDRAGWSSGFAGDVNQDGVADIIMGSWAADPVGPESGMATVFSGANGSVLHVFPGQAPGERFGQAVAGAGDANADGYADLIIGAREASGKRGRYELRSGKDGSLLQQGTGALTGDYLGASVAGAGDANGDGHADFLVGAVGYDEAVLGVSIGAVYLYSGSDGSLLHKKTGFATSDAFGTSVRGVGDVDGDGLGDFIVGATQGFGAGAGPGYAQVYSGGSGALLFHFSGENANDQFGHAVSGAGDVNGDGVPDFIVGAYLSDIAAFNGGKATIYSGSTGAYLYAHAGLGVGDQFGFAVGAAGDVNGDGFGDVIVGANADDRGGSSAGSLKILSVQGGMVLHDILGNAAGDQLGFSVAGDADVTGDGYGEFLAGAIGVQQLSGAVYVYRGTPLTLLVDSSSLSLGSGGAQGMTLRAGPSYAGSAYFVAGSASGTTPGIALGGLLLPLNFDPYFLYTVNSPNQPPLYQTFGFLDPAGNAQAFFVVPPGVAPNLAGSTLHHAFVVIDASGPFWTFPYASNAAAVHLLP